MTSEEASRRMTAQLEWLCACLEDACPAVREAAAEGCGALLGLWWEVVPSAASAKMMTTTSGARRHGGGRMGARDRRARGLRSGAGVAQPAGHGAWPLQLPAQR